MDRKTTTNRITYRNERFVVVPRNLLSEHIMQSSKSQVDLNYSDYASLAHTVHQSNKLNKDDCLKSTSLRNVSVISELSEPMQSRLNSNGKKGGGRFGRPFCQKFQISFFKVT